MHFRQVLLAGVPRNTHRSLSFAWARGQGSLALFRPLFSLVHPCLVRSTRRLCFPSPNFVLLLPNLVDLTGLLSRSLVFLQSYWSPAHRPFLQAHATTAHQTSPRSLSARPPPMDHQQHTSCCPTCERPFAGGTFLPGFGQGETPKADSGLSPQGSAADQLG